MIWPVEKLLCHWFICIMQGWLWPGFGSWPIWKGRHQQLFSERDQELTLPDNFSAGVGAIVGLFSFPTSPVAQAYSYSSLALEESDTWKIGPKKVWLKLQICPIFTWDTPRVPCDQKEYFISSRPLFTIALAYSFDSDSLALCRSLWFLGALTNIGMALTLWLSDALAQWHIWVPEGWSDKPRGLKVQIPVQPNKPRGCRFESQYGEPNKPRGRRFESLYG